MKVLWIFNNVYHIIFTADTLESTIEVISDVENMIYVLIDEVEDRLSNVQVK